MSGRLRFKSYRDQAEMERDAGRMAGEGWLLRGWRIRGRGGGLQGPPEALGVGAYATLGPYGCGYAVFELLRTAVWLLAWVFAAPYMLSRGRKRIDAAYEREQERLP